MKLKEIQHLVQLGKFRIKRHSLPHRLKEGFSAADMVQAVMNGKVIEEYPERNRCLVCDRALLTKGTKIWLHVVCDYSDPEWIEFVTGYIPLPEEWETPPVKRKKKR